MAVTVNNANMKMSVTAGLSSDPDIGSASQSISYSQTITFTDGSGANQINAIWQDSRQISAGSTDDIDLAGVLTDAFGNTLTFTTIKGMAIFAYAANGDNIKIGGDATAAFINWVDDATDEVIVAPGGFFMLGNPSAAGYAVTATTGDILQITNADGAAAVDYDIILFGAE